MTKYTMRFLWWDNDDAEDRAQPIELFAPNGELAKKEAWRLWLQAANGGDPDGYIVVDEEGGVPDAFYAGDRVLPGVHGYLRKLAEEMAPAGAEPYWPT